MPLRDRRTEGMLDRFSRAERWIHHVTALLMLVCLVTAALLYVPALSAAVGRRDLIKPLHVYAGFALPVPVLLGLLSRAFRADLSRFNRFDPADWEWLQRRDRRDVTYPKDGPPRGVVPIGKFNPGQKLNAAFTMGAILVMLGTGAILTFPDPWPDRWRTGATFMHDWLFLIILVVTLGHLWYAARDPGALGGMLTGRVDRAWAARHHPGWLDEHERGGGIASGNTPETPSKRHPENPDNPLKTRPNGS
ncbi:formate dehydrogenase subunit gamma [Actinomadura sp. NBRC 104412]|uniref:cytochrome b/b6 domain-containing protein n=1 Tax=Actinomadura sp. NBRC 104412 TaxID=3032203 RepID=UPI0024A51582|nr:cytochrome b/b6 domain-containing protein [Actinomadura sp. NBRC 104412]GLZ05794.1 formate dehydrogenase subunit gamma [Actinomadura sp. NBRC 104412]